MQPEIFFDIINIALVFAFLAIIQYKYKFGAVIMGLLVFHFALIFLTNYVLFDPGYMPDQFKYLNTAMTIRDNIANLTDAAVSWDSQVHYAGAFFALFPIPVINSIYSISIINYILYVLLFIFLYQRNVLKGFGFYFFMLYPSLALYSALSLRDTITLFCMVLSVYYILERRYVPAVLFTAPLLLIKLQNVLVFAVALSVFILVPAFIRKTRDKNVGIVYKVFGLVILMGILYGLTRPYFYSILDKYRKWFFIYESGGEIYDYVRISSLPQLIQSSLRAFPYAFIRPFPWEAQNSLQLIQSGENFLILLVILYLVLIQAKYKIMNRNIAFLYTYFIIGLVFYGLIIVNFGTLSRYKFPFLTIFVIFLYRELVEESQRIESRPTLLYAPV